jgi:hypothetical protein
MPFCLAIEAALRYGLLETSFRLTQISARFVADSCNDVTAL